MACTQPFRLPSQGEKKSAREFLSSALHPSAIRTVNRLTGLNGKAEQERQANQGECLDANIMDRGAPSDVELLDMAREVLAVCSDRSLKDIIEDLTMTGSSEMTINRTFDGQVISKEPRLFARPSGSDK